MLIARCDAADMPRITRCTVRPWEPNEVSTKPCRKCPASLADDPAVIEPDVAVRRESGDGLGHAVLERVLAVERLHRAGEPDPVALGQGDGLRPVEREFRRLLDSGTAAGSVTVSRSPLVKPPLAFWWNWMHVARPVGGRLPAFGFAGIDLHQPGEFAVLLAQLPGVAQLRADRRRDAVPLRRASGDTTSTDFLSSQRLQVIGRDVPVAVVIVGDFLDPAHAVDGVEALRASCLRRAASPPPGSPGFPAAGFR